MAPSALLSEPEPEYVVVHAGKGTIKRQILTGDQKKPTFETIPQVDFSNFDSPNLSERQAVAKEVGAAFRDSGFLYAVNHGISEELQAEVYKVMREFFALPLEEKMKVRRDTDFLNERLQDRYISTIQKQSEVMSRFSKLN
jgi:isopenicillin N synthase-like dioxygenase